MAEERSGFIFRVLISLARIMFVFCGKTQVNVQASQKGNTRREAYLTTNLQKLIKLLTTWVSRRVYGEKHGERFTARTRVGGDRSKQS